LINRLTLPAEFKTVLDQFAGDIGETNEAFDGLFGWPTKEATKLDTTSRKRDKQRKATSADATFATGGGDALALAEGAKRQRHWKTIANGGWSGRDLHCNGALEQLGSRGEWHYDGQLVKQQSQIKMASDGPVWCDAEGKPRFCNEVDKMTKTKCTGVHPKTVCPIHRRNGQAGYQPNLHQDIRKEHQRKRKGKHQKQCRFWAKGSCREGNSCKYQHNGDPGRNNGHHKKPKKGKQGGISAATMQTMAAMVVSMAMQAAQHPPPAKKGEAADDLGSE
jgi:hypothetical protein